MRILRILLAFPTAIIIVAVVWSLIWLVTGGAVSQLPWKALFSTACVSWLIYVVGTFVMMGFISWWSGTGIVFPVLTTFAFALLPSLVSPIFNPTVLVIPQLNIKSVAIQAFLNGVTFALSMLVFVLVSEYKLKRNRYEIS